MADDDRDVVRPGSPDPEHAAFVLLGMLASAAVVVHLYRVFTG